MGELDLVVGVLLLGLFFNTYLFGVVCSQFLVYYRGKLHDPLWIRLIVGTLFIVDTTHTAVGIYAAWDMCVTNYGNPQSLLFINWTIPFTAIATSVTAILSQIFLGHRVMILTRNYVVVVAIGIFSLNGFVFGCMAGIKSGIISEIAQFGPLEPYVITWLSSQTAADILITMTLIYALSRSRTGFKKTDTLINKLIRGAIQTGLFASAFAMADLCSFILHRKTNLYAMFAYPIGRIYTNTLLATLNARRELVNLSRHTDVLNSEPLFRLPAGTMDSMPSSKNRVRTTPSVIIEPEEGIDMKPQHYRPESGLAHHETVV